MATQDNIYEPTAGEKKLLEILVNPEHYSKNVKTICGLAGVDRTVYYDAMKKPEFVKYYNKLVVEMMKGKVSDIMKATVKFATAFSQNHQDRKLLLEMAGVYTPKQELEHTGKDGGPIEFEQILRDIE